MKAGQVFIEGTWRPPVSGETYAIINPATEEESARVEAVPPALFSR